MSLVLAMETLDRELVRAAVWAGAVPCVLAVEMVCKAKGLDDIS